MKDSLQPIKVSSKFECLDLNYLHSFEDKELKLNMLELLQKELSEYQKYYSHSSIKTDTHSLFHRVHKLSSKFSILGMRKSYQFVKKLEHQIQENILPEDDLNELLALCKHTEKLIQKEIELLTNS